MLKKYLFATVVLFVASLSIGCFGGRGPTVDASDLARLSPEGVDSLKPTESEVFSAKVDLERSEQQLAEAKELVDELDRLVKVEKLDLEAAEAEVKAAKANEDRERIDRANAEKAAADQVYEETRRRRQEARETRQMAENIRDAAEAKLALSRARREAARARQLVAEGVASSEQLDLTKFEEQVSEAAARYDKLAKRAGIIPSA